MRIIIDNLEPCPRNRSHTIVNRGKFSQNIKTEAARMYETALSQLLTPFAKHRDEFFKAFDSSKHGIYAKFYHGTPELFTKTGKINLNSVDLDAHKVLKDVIADFIGIDDGYVIKATDMKFHYPSHLLVIDLEIVPKDLSGELDFIGMRYQ